ncbi:hypothetical protein DY000_02014486 [Brassica cretica]|uniref:Uncharacterized protein n=1 Tax=Brassica cretica TaxID=69181 RepID=A0ABQ7CZC2_BRACR|nr:hypothetical protein DY000_02014486 [Brassica cretica]
MPPAAVNQHHVVEVILVLLKTGESTPSNSPVGELDRASRPTRPFGELDQLACLRTVLTAPSFGIGSILLLLHLDRSHRWNFTIQKPQELVCSYEVRIDREDKCQDSKDKCEVFKDKHEDQRKMEYFRQAINSTNGRKGKNKPPLGGVYKDVKVEEARGTILFTLRTLCTQKL